MPRDPQLLGALFRVALAASLDLITFGELVTGRQVLVDVMTVLRDEPGIGILLSLISVAILSVWYAAVGWRLVRLPQGFDR